MILGSAELRRLIDETLPADAAPGEKIVVGMVNQQGAQIVASFKKTGSHQESWEVQAAARHDWNGDNSVGAKVLLRWK